MLKKLLWFILIVFVLYVVYIFIAPAEADKLWDRIWILPFNKKVRELKANFDEIYSNLPNQEEVQEFYDKTKSWAIEWANTVKWKVDDIRGNLNDTKTKIEDTKNKYNQTMEAIDTTRTQIEWSVNTINSFSWLLSTWSTSK